METSGIPISEESWVKLPICPDEESEKKVKNTDYIETCPKSVETCGRYIFNITTTSTKTIVPGNNSIVPVIGSGKESLKSAVIVYGCGMSEQKSCDPGYTLEFKVPMSSNASEESEVISEIIVKNTEAACCYCAANGCNVIDGSLNCNVLISDSNHGTAVASSGISHFLDFGVILGSLVVTSVSFFQ